jgi:hypothetical protein
MDPKEEDALVLRLAIEHLRATGEWPTLRNIHQRIHQHLDGEVDIEVRDVARRLAPHPFFSAFQDLNDTFAPPLVVLGRVREGAPLLAGVLEFVVYALQRYRSSSGEALVSEVEFAAETDVPRDIAAVARRLVGGVPFLTHGGGSGPEGWYFTVSDDVIRWAKVDTVDDLLERLNAIEQQTMEQYAAISDAKARLVRGQGPPPIAESKTHPDTEGVRVDPTDYFRSVALRLGAGTASARKDLAFPPQVSDMPDLSGLYSKNILPWILNITLRAQGPTSHPSVAYTAGYVRLVDKAVREYELSRHALEEFVDGGAESLSPYFRAADHLENCLNATRRAIRYAHRIRRDPDALHVEKHELPIKGEEGRVAAFRNATEHAEQQLADGTLQEGEATILMIHQGSFSLGNYEESFRWLAELLTELHALASRVAGVAKRPGAQGPEP